MDQEGHDDDRNHNVERQHHVTPRVRFARWATPGTAALIGAIAVTTVACGTQTPAQPMSGTERRRTAAA